MDAKQETKSLPRNRKCGNCRYFEPAPLWRKGWCRNPRLYDRRANHLVDAATIDCEQVFRARIYWEPVPTPEIPAAQTVITPLNSAADASADGGRNSRVPSDGVLRPLNNQNRPVINRGNPAQPQPQPQPPVEVVMPDEIIESREKASALPGVVKKGSSARKWMVENIPYYDKVDGPLGRLNWRILTPVLVIAVLLFILLVILPGRNNNTTTTSTNTPPVATNSAATGSVAATTAPIATPAPAGAATNTGGKTVPTATLSTNVPTPIPPTTAPPAAATEKKAKVVGTGPSGLNVRSATEAGKTDNIVTKVIEGDTVTIIGGPTIAGGYEWWKIRAANGKEGWAVKEYLQEVK